MKVNSLLKTHMASLDTSDTSLPESVKEFMETHVEKSGHSAPSEYLPQLMREDQGSAGTWWRGMGYLISTKRTPRFAI